MHAVHMMQDGYCHDECTNVDLQEWAHSTVLHPVSSRSRTHTPGFGGQHISHASSLKLPSCLAFYSDIQSKCQEQQKQKATSVQYILFVTSNSCDPPQAVHKHAWQFPAHSNSTGVAKLLMHDPAWGKIKLMKNECPKNSGMLWCNTGRISNNIHILLLRQ